MELPTYTREDLLFHHGAHQYLDEVPELPPVIREVAPEEQTEVYISCMGEYGYVVRLDEVSGGRVVEWDLDQAESYWTAGYMCAAQYPLTPKYYQPYNAEQLRMLYDWQLEEAIPCLEGLGFTITEEPPTFESFYGEYAMTGAVVWLAHRYVDGEIQNDTQDLCPPRPPTEVFFAPLD